MNDKKTTVTIQHVNGPLEMPIGRHLAQRLHHEGLAKDRCQSEAIGGIIQVLCDRGLITVEEALVLVPGSDQFPVVGGER